jgi:hypothetical protein
VEHEVLGIDEEVVALGSLGVVERSDGGEDERARAEGAAWFARHDPEPVTRIEAGQQSSRSARSPFA